MIATPGGWGGTYNEYFKTNTGGKEAARKKQYVWSPDYGVSRQRN